MDDQVKNVLHYWRNSLADSALGKGAFTERSIQEIGYQRPVARGYLSGKLENTGPFFPRRAEGVEKGVTPDYVKVSLHPLVFKKIAGHSHGMEVEAFVPDILAPISMTAWLHRDGRLFTGTRPVIGRDVMDPLIQDRGFVVVSIDQFDEFNDRTSFGGRDEHPSGNDDSGSTVFSWQDTVKYVDSLALVMDIPPDHYVPANYFLISPCDTVSGTTRKIINLYDRLIEGSPEVPLLSLFIEKNLTENWRSKGALSLDVPCKDATETVCLRMGHSDPEFPLALGQRDAVGNFLSLGENQTLAVNGPPGTGKTTLLQSLLASLLVKRAIAGDAPPIILACSANNQAVTNIIDAFSKVPERKDDPLSGRWVPGIASMGVYHPSTIKAKQAVVSGYFTIEQLSAMELDEDYQAHAEEYYLQRASSALGRPYATVREVRSDLRAQLIALSDRIVRTVGAYRAYAKAKEDCAGFFGECDESLQSAQILSREKALKDRVRVGKRWNSLALAWEEHMLSKTFVEKVLFFMPAVKKSRWIKACRTFNSFSTMTDDLQGSPLDNIEALVSNKTDDEIHALLLGSRSETVQKIRSHKDWITLAKKLIKEAVDSREAVCQLDSYCQSSVDGAISLEKYDLRLDTTLRYEMFRLAIHYYEGGWIEECSKLDKDPDKKTPAKQLRKARRQAMVTPCNVSTFFMAPELFYSYNNGFVPAYNLADLLIVDEAGQVSPEVAGATFALARNALVVGDVWQIEPVWSAQKPADGGNLVECHLARPKSTQDDLEAIHSRGYTSSAGSVMKMAQNASLFHYNAAVERGMYLVEHRRCADSIIQYCNDLCYHGILVPLVGEPVDAHYPPFAYMDIPGHCSRESGSRVNLIEAEFVAAWIAAESKNMESVYQKPIEAIVAVVTPFKAQANAIMRALRKRNEGLSKITVGTVHSLQGAERLIVIFSTTYDSQSAGSFFFDRGVNMMNVAVSRAKHSFLVFGATSILNAKRSSPSALLSKHLARAGSVQIPLPLIDEHLRLLMGKNCAIAPRSLFETSEHDAFLISCLDSAEKSLSIVSPWISWKVVERFAERFKGAVERGVEVKVFYDHSKLSTPEQAKAVECLEGMGVKMWPLRRLLSKLIAKDDNLLTTGSFNWLSARDVSPDQKPFEHTMVFDADRVGREEVNYHMVSVRLAMARWEKENSSW